jgi:hypothetical protein
MHRGSCQRACQRYNGVLYIAIAKGPPGGARTRLLTDSVCSRTLDPSRIKPAKNGVQSKMVMSSSGIPWGKILLYP